MTAKKAKAKAAPKPDAVANMGAGADELNAESDKAKAPSVEDRLSALEKAHADHVSLAQRNGWSV